MTGSVLSPVEASWVLAIGFTLLMCLRVPIAFALGLSIIPILAI